MVHDVDLLLEPALRRQLTNLSQTLRVHLHERVELLSVDVIVLREVELRLLLIKPLIRHSVSILLVLSILHLTTIAKDLKEVLHLVADVLLLFHAELVDVAVEDILLLAYLVCILGELLIVDLLGVGLRGLVTHVDGCLDPSLDIETIDTLKVHEEAEETLECLLRVSKKILVPDVVDWYELGNVKHQMLMVSIECFDLGSDELLPDLWDVFLEIFI